MPPGGDGGGGGRLPTPPPAFRFAWGSPTLCRWAAPPPPPALSSAWVSPTFRRGPATLRAWALTTPSSGPRARRWDRRLAVSAKWQGQATLPQIVFSDASPTGDTNPKRQRGDSQRNG